MSDLDYQIGECEATIEVMKSLMEHPGYKHLKQVFKQQEILRRNAVLVEQYEGLDGLIKRDQLVSELRGINTVLSMPGLIIQEAEMCIDALRAQLIEESEDAT